MANGRTFVITELTKYHIAFSKTTAKPNLIYQKLKKRKNNLEKEAKKLIET